jgi:hypothetical protein
MEAWKDYIMCRVNWRGEPQMGTKLLSRRQVLLGNPHLAAFVRCGSPLAYPVSLGTGSDRSEQRTLVVDLADGTNGATKLFVKCLTASPNLRTLDIVSM